MNLIFVNSIQFLILFLIKIARSEYLNLSAHTGCVRTVLFNDDGNLISTSDDKKIKIWNISNRSFTILKYLTNANMNWNSILIKNDLLVAATNNITNIWNLTNGMNIRKYFEHSGIIRSYAVSNMNILASGSDDFQIKIWNMSLNQSMETIQEYKSMVFSLVFLSNDTLISGYSDGLIKLWNITNSVNLMTLFDHKGNVFSIFKLENDIFVSGSGDLTIKIWNITNSSCIKTLNAHSAWIPAITKITNSVIASVSDDKKIKIWDLNSYTNIYTLNVSLNGYRSVSYSPKLDILAAGTINGFITILFNVSSVFNQELQKTSIKNVEETTSPTIFIDEEKKAEYFISNLFKSNNSTISFDFILLNNSIQLIIGLFKQSKYDIIDCLSNCSNKGLCKLGRNNKLICQCESLFKGSKCNVDLRPCSYSPCLNSIGCQNIINSNGTIDFECLCKDKSKYFGKRCENKVNLCYNEKCSGNGLCKIQNENEINETIRCECFGIGLYEGEKCQAKSTKLIIIQTTIKTTSYIAIICIILFYVFVVTLDVHYLVTQPNKKKVIKKKKIARKLVYVP